MFCPPDGLGGARHRDRRLSPELQHHPTALENGASLEDVQRAAGHRETGTIKLYDRRGYNPEKSASFFATY